MEISNLEFNKQFKVMVIQMLTNLGEEWRTRKNFNREMEDIRKYQPELKNTITKMNSTLEGTKEQSKDLEDRVVRITQTKHKKNNNFKK